MSDSPRKSWCVKLHMRGVEVCGCFDTKAEALEFQLHQLCEKANWPRQALADTADVERDPLWDHPEDLERSKEYSFVAPEATREAAIRDCSALVRSNTSALSRKQLHAFSTDGFLTGIPCLSPEELRQARTDFEFLISQRTDKCPTDGSRFRAAHTLARPLHQELVARLAQHPKIVSIVGDVLGPRFACWSAHLFCKLPGDPTQQPWHQDAGFWPLSASRALTVWVAFDDVDSSNAPVTFVRGSHRLGRIPWQRTTSTHHLLTQEIPDVDLLGECVQSVLKAGEISVHCDLTIHSSAGNFSGSRRGGLALRFVGADADCLGPMINGYRMNQGCILPKGRSSDPRGHWRALRKRGGKKRTTN